MRRAGWKICVNDPRVQARLGLDAPFVGWLNGARVIASGGRYPVPDDARLACEPEIAIRIAAGGDPAAADGARAAIASVAPALEVVDYARISPELATIVETSSFHHGMVVGEPRPLAALPVLGPACPRLTRNGAAAGVPDASLVPADLAAIVAHVVACLRACGETLRPGDWILSGACAAPIPVAAGDEVVADFGSLGTARVTFGAPGEFALRPSDL